MPATPPVLDLNIASLYSQMGELEAAAQWIEGALERVSGKDRRDHLPKLLIQLATVRARQDRMAEASELFPRGNPTLPIAPATSRCTPLAGTGWAKSS